MVENFIVLDVEIIKEFIDLSSKTDSNKCYHYNHIFRYYCKMVQEINSKLYEYNESHSIGIFKKELCN